MSQAATRVHTVIIGAGFSGLGMAIRLREQGLTDFVVLERAEAVGGVWRDNRYPGCACDVESALYSFSFAPNPNWSQLFAGQAEIWAYLRDCVARYGLDPHLRLGESLVSARWQAEQQCWQITSSRAGVTRHWRASFLVAATGAFSAPEQPQLPGQADFRGRIFHAARWPEALDLRDQRVAVMGTGASAIQLIPALQAEVAQLLVLQRTPAWVLPRHDRPLSPAVRACLARWPLLQQLWRQGIYVLREAYGLSFRHPRLMRLSQRLALRHLARAVADPVLRAQLTPDYLMGCKRVLLSDTYYPALTQPHVQLLVSPLQRLEADGLRTADGVFYPLDVLILATGFQVAAFPLARQLYDGAGRSLAEAWQGSPQTHLGLMVAEFPNLFVLLGPHTGLGHSSVVLMIEAQIAQVGKALAHLAATGQRALAPRPERQQAYVQAVEAASQRTVWASGCRSWYLDASGRNATLWPGGIGRYVRRLRRFEPDDYLFT